MDVYPDNTLANFKVKLGRPIQLTGSYEVGLVEIIYPNKALNVQMDEATMRVIKKKITRIWPPKTPKNDVPPKPKKVSSKKPEERQKVKEAIDEWTQKKMAYDRMVREHKKLLVEMVGAKRAAKWLKDGLPEHYDMVETKNWIISLDPGLYTNISGLHKKLSEKLEPGNDVTIELDAVHSIFTVKLASSDNWKRKLILSPRMAELLGFPATEKGYTTSTTQKAPLLPQLEGNAHSLYIYSSVVDNQLVGDTVAPLLRVVCPAADQMGAKVTEKYIRPYYMAVNTNYIDMIDIQIRTTTGHLYPFLSGDPVVLNLHFRPRQN
jgi:hypothetical protein